MEQDSNGSSDPTRLDRIERIVEVIANTQADMQHELIILTRSQVTMGETITNMGGAITKVADGLAELAEAQKHTDQRMDALILVVDELVRGRKPQ